MRQLAVLRPAAMLLNAGLVLAAGCGSGNGLEDHYGDDYVPGKKLTEAEARLLGTRLANQAFAKKTFVDEDGRPVGPVALEPSDWEEVQTKGNRWELDIDDEDDHPWAEVSFRLNGAEPKVKVGYGDD